MSAKLHELTPRAENGSHLSPELAAMVRTDEFKAWFGDWEGDPASASKIVDENGEPALVYFGGPSGIKALSGDKRNRTGEDEVGFYFTHRPQNARFFAETLYDPLTYEPVLSSVYGTFLNIRRPYVKNPGDGVGTERVTVLPEGYDGYINKTVHELVAFSPDQVMLVQEEPVRFLV